MRASIKLIALQNVDREPFIGRKADIVFEVLLQILCKIIDYTVLYHLW